MISAAHRRGNSNKKTTSLPTSCGFGLLTGLTAVLILLPVTTGIAYAQADPARMAVPAAVVTLYLSVLLSGAAAAHNSETPFLAAGICGSVFLLTTVIFTLFPIGSASCEFSTPVSILAHLAVPAAAMLGSLAGRRRPKRPSSHHRRRR